MPRTNILDMLFPTVTKSLRIRQRKGRTEVEMDEEMRWFIGHSDLEELEQQDIHDYLAM